MCRLRVAFLSPLCVDIRVDIGVDIRVAFVFSFRVAFSCRLRVDLIVAFLCVAFNCRLFVVLLYRLFVSLLSSLVSPFCHHFVSTFVSPFSYHLRVDQLSPFCRPFVPFVSSFCDLTVTFCVAFVSPFCHLSYPDVARGRRRLRRLCPTPRVASPVHSSLLSPVKGVTPFVALL